MRNVWLAVAAMLILVSVGNGYWWDAEKILQGRQMLDSGAPWFSDDAKMYFGDGKDASIGFGSDSGTLDITGPAKLSTVAVGVNATTNKSTTLTTTNTNTVFPMDASGASVTLTLPDASTVNGRLYMVAVSKDMGTNNIVVGTTGAGKIGGESGADTLSSTDATAALSVISNGAHYLVISKVGTWT